MDPTVNAVVPQGIQMDPVETPRVGSADLASTPLPNQVSHNVDQYDEIFPPLQPAKPAEPKKLSIKLRRKPANGADGPPTSETAPMLSSSVASGGGGNYRFTYECHVRKTKDSSKRPPMLSPVKDRTLKRHTSASIPPYGTPESRNLSLRLRESESPSPAPQACFPSSQGPPIPTPPCGTPLEPQNSFLQPPIIQPSLPQEAPTPLVATHEQRVTEAPPTVHAGLPTPDCSNLAEEQVWMKNGSDPLFGIATAPPPSNAEILNPRELSTGIHAPPRHPPHSIPDGHRTFQRQPGSAPGRGYTADTWPPPGFREVTENYITTNSKGLRRTAAPNRGWPKVHLLSTPWENVADSQAEAWSLVTSPKLWARVFRGKYEPNSLEIVDKTQEIIKKLIPIDGEISWGVSFPPQKCRIDTDRFPTPYHMLISGISAD
ncbi:hypothetical protein C0992_010562 [Termitomyces sp. T32_za158]|nr:hypothetical protein C0992_010562 [Termitomyces sp. T32_za158]